MNINVFDLHLETDKLEIFLKDTEIAGLFYFHISAALFCFLKFHVEVILEIVIFNDYFFGDSMEITIFKFHGVLYP